MKGISRQHLLEVITNLIRMNYVSVDEAGNLHLSLRSMAVIAASGGV